MLTAMDSFFFLKTTNFKQIGFVVSQHEFNSGLHLILVVWATQVNTVTVSLVSIYLSESSY